MLAFVIIACAIWCAGAATGAPKRALRGVVALVWIGAGVALFLPADHAWRGGVGDDPALWLPAVAVATMALLYRELRWRRPAGAAAAKPFTRRELERYARHIMLREIGGPGQRKLAEARVLVIGAGGLGSPALLYLAAAGVGTIGIVDDDKVEISNLQRQVIHRSASVGEAKADSAAEAMAALNPHVRIVAALKRLDDRSAAELIGAHDVILDGTDNFETRYLANATAARLGKPLVSGALSQWEGQVSVFDPARGTPCYQCVFPQPPAPDNAPSCAEAGVLGPLPGVVGAMMAAEAVKLICGAGSPLAGRMAIHDALHGETRMIELSRRADCPVCAGAG